jgi:hypothetical protein
MGGTLRMSKFKILSMRYIKLAQKTTGAKISALALKGKAVGVTPTATAATARDRRNKIYRSNHVF